MRKALFIPYELVPLFVSMAYCVIGLMLSVYFYGEPMTAALPVCAVAWALAAAAVTALGYGRRSRDWLAPGWRIAAWSLLGVTSLMLILEIGYGYAPDGIANTMPLFPQAVYAAVFGAVMAAALTVLALYLIRWRDDRDQDKILVPGTWSDRRL